MNLFKSVGGFATLKYGRLSLSGNYTFSQQSSESESDYLRTQSGDGAKLRMLSDVDVKYPAHYGSLEGSFEIDTLNFDLLVRKLEYRKQQLYLE